MSQAAALAENGAGHALDAPLQSEMESLLGEDLSAVRVHRGDAAARAAAGIGARAYTIGDAVVFGAGEYAPATADGRRTLVHELVHVLQQRQGPAPRAEALDTRDRFPNQAVRVQGWSSSIDLAPAGGVHERQAEAVAEGALAGSGPPGFVRAARGIHRLEQDAPATSGVGMSVSLDGLMFDVPATMTFRPGPEGPQLLAIVLRRLLGPQYRPGLENEALVELGKYSFERGGGFARGQRAKGGEPIYPITLELQPTLVLTEWLKARRFQLQLTEQQAELLQLGVAGLNLWVDFVDTLKRGGNPLPSWYSRTIFEQEIAQQGALLRRYSEQLAKARSGSESDRLAGYETVNEIIDALYQPAMVLEAVRLDVSLASNAATQGAYAAVWQLPPAPKGAAPKLTAPPAKLRDVGTGVLFLGYLRTQPELARDAEDDQTQRIELVRRFGRFIEQLTFAGTKQGDQEIRDQPATANYPAFPSTLSAIPMLPPPLFDAALGTDHRFGMEVQFPSVYEALGRYAFNWELVRIPDDKIGQPVDVSKLKGEHVSTGDVAAVRFGRDTAYAKADIARVIDTMASDIGPAGVGALELVSANAILRYIGTGIRLGLEILTTPANQKLVVFPAPGLYMVRAAMSQVREGGEEVVRAPSVAYYPVLAREPDEMAAGGLKGALTAREQTRQRITELQSRLNQPALDPRERQQINQELDALRLSIAPLGERLERRRTEAADQVKAIKSGATPGDLDAATKAQENIEKVIALRAKRNLKDAQELDARFVSDLGQTLALTLEVVERRRAKDGPVEVYVSDTTTPRSGDATGTGRTRDAAIVAAVKNLLESIHGYGRGRVAIAVGDGVRTLRIEASLGSLLTESVENVSTVLSIAAIAAAPFTGGASLSLLVPLGLVGAVPSAYRVVMRVEAGTFDLSLESALEIANIAGSVVGLGRLGATSLRMVRLGEAMLIVGFGVDAANGLLMGAQLMQQIEALSKLEPGERSAALLMLIGQTMISAGVTVGGALAARAQQSHAEGTGGRRPGLHDEAPASTGASPTRQTGSGAEIIERARVDSEVGRLGRMDPESEARLRSDERLRRSLNDQPLAAAALKKCASPCFPPGVTPEQVARLDRLLSRVGETGGYDEAALRKYLYDRRTDLNKAIAQIEGARNGADLNVWLEYFNKGGEITRLPPRGDPAALLAQRDRAHDYGVERGRAEALADGHDRVGFTNPLESYGRYGQGFDDVMKKGPNLDIGEVYIVEYKGGDAVLAKGQMELDWVVGNIRRLYLEGGAAGQQWARTLAKALREGRLRGVAYSTPIVSGTPQATRPIGKWAYTTVNISFP